MRPNLDTHPTPPPCAFSLFSTPIRHPPPIVSGGWFFCQKKKVASHHMLTQPRWFVWKVKVEKSKTELLHVLVEANMRNRFRFSKPWKYEFLVKIDTRQKKENGEQIFFTKLIYWIFIFNIGRGFGVLNRGIYMIGVMSVAFNNEVVQTWATDFT